MKKAELVATITQFAEHRDIRWKGQKTLMRFFAGWLDRLEVAQDAKYDFWQIDSYVPQLIVDALDDLRNGTDEFCAGFRTTYVAETGHDVPDVTDLGASDLLDQTMLVQTVGFSLRDGMGLDHIERSFDAYANAQRYVLQHTFDKFVRLVYRQGLCELIDASRHRGMSGRFGKTDLRSFVMAGRVMLTFARRRRGVTTVSDATGAERLRLPYVETSVSFVAEQDDKNGLSAGIQSTQATLIEAMTMIDDVINHWPTSKMERSKIYRHSKDVCIA